MTATELKKLLVHRIAEIEDESFFYAIKNMQALILYFVM